MAFLYQIFLQHQFEHAEVHETGVLIEDLLLCDEAETALKVEFLRGGISLEDVQADDLRMISSLSVSVFIVLPF